MAKVNAPLLSFGGSGTIAKTVVYSKWKGVPYTRQRVIPANPQTVAQQLVRTTFSELREMWKIAPTELVAPWTEFAKGRPFTNMNKFVGENLRVVRGEPDFANFIGSPGARGGLPPVAFTPTTGSSSGEIDFAFTTPAPPSGWTLTSADVVAFPDQVPGGIFSGTFTADSVSVGPYSGTLSGLTPGADYVVSGWLVWEKPDGSPAYSVSTTSIVAADA